MNDLQYKHNQILKENNIMREENDIIRKKFMDEMQEKENNFHLKEQKLILQIESLKNEVYKN